MVRGANPSALWSLAGAQDIVSSKKDGALRESVISALRAQLERNGTSACRTQDEIRAAEMRLRQATGLIEETGVKWERELERNSFEVQNGFLAASARLMDEWGRHRGAVVSAFNDPGSKMGVPRTRD